MRHTSYTSCGPSSPPSHNTRPHDADLREHTAGGNPPRPRRGHPGRGELAAREPRRAPPSSRVQRNAVRARRLDAHVIVETWQVGGIQRKVILGDVVSRGSAAPSPDEPWLAAFTNALQSLPLASGTHWVRVFFGQQDGARMTLEVLLDNEPWQALTDLLDIAPWPSAPGFLCRRNSRAVPRPSSGSCGWTRIRTGANPSNWPSRPSAGTPG